MKFWDAAQVDLRAVEIRRTALLSASFQHALSAALVELVLILLHSQNGQRINMAK